ncbi:MAG: hypothetical protein J6D52_07880 [Clostridia bacterium]|nr:hypothetical protein [Clostridia bacterium]
MSIKKVETKITTYQLTDNFFVEAQETMSAGEEVINFWIYHKQYGVKSLMVGLKKSDIQKDCFESAVMYSAESLAKEHMRFYYEEHMDYNSDEEAEIDAYCGEEE